MGDVIAWSKLNKITKMVKNLPTSLATNFGEVKDSISGLVSNFDGWKAPWTSTRASKLDKVDAIANDTHSVWNSIPSGTDSVAKQSTLNTVNSTLNSVNSSMAKASNLATVNSTLNSVNSNVGTINSNVSTLVQNMGTVKTSQRGTFDSGVLECNLKISTVDPNKVMILFYGGYMQGSKPVVIKKIEITENNIHFIFLERTYSITYQILEFY